MTSVTFHVRRTIADAIKMKGIMWPFIYIHTPIVRFMSLSLLTIKHSPNKLRHSRNFRLYGEEFSLLANLNIQSWDGYRACRREMKIIQIL